MSRIGTPLKQHPEPRSGVGIGCLIWLISIMIVILVFVWKWPAIEETMRTSGFLEALRSRLHLEGTTTTVPKAPVVTPTTSRPLPGGGSGTTETVVQDDTGTTQDTIPEVTTEEPAPVEAPPVRFRKTSLFFVRIDDDGMISRQEVQRDIPMSQTPLQDAMAALLKGPNEEELRRKLVSLIPPGTVLLSLRVQGSTAVLDFNEAFMFNKFGIEGYAAQLRQVVYTATAFASIQDVQILIDGKNRPYLGGEGVYIGGSLSRYSLR